MDLNLKNKIKFSSITFEKLIAMPFIGKYDLQMESRKDLLHALAFATEQRKKLPPTSEKKVNSKSEANFEK